MLSTKNLEEIAEALQADKLYASRSDIEVACVKAYFDSLADDDDVPPEVARTELYRVTTYCIEYCNKLRKAENFEIRQRQKENKNNNVLDAPLEVTGAFFLVGEGGAKTVYGRTFSDGSMGYGERSIGITYTDAKAWAAKHPDNWHGVKFCVSEIRQSQGWR